jgi:hypothetical protein
MRTLAIKPMLAASAASSFGLNPGTLNFCKLSSTLGLSLVVRCIDIAPCLSSLTQQQEQSLKQKSNLEAVQKRLLSNRQFPSQRELVGGADGIAATAVLIWAASFAVMELLGGAGAKATSIVNEVLLVLSPISPSHVSSSSGIYTRQP